MGVLSKQFDSISPTEVSAIGEGCDVMGDNKPIGWVAFTLFALAVVIVALVVFWPVTERYNIALAEAALQVVCALALLGSVTGFLAFRTLQGKIAAIGGLLLLIPTVLLLLLSPTTPTLVQDRKSHEVRFRTDCRYTTDCTVPEREDRASPGLNVG